MAHGTIATAKYFDLRRFLDAPDGPPLDRELLRRRRPKGNDLARTAFTSGTTGDPKAVLHKFAELRIDAVNRALVGIPEERVRYHL